MADEKKATASKESKALNKAQKTALEVLEWAQSLDEIVAAMAALKPEERNDKRIGFLVHQAMERIVNRMVPLL